MSRLLITALTLVTAIMAQKVHSSSGVIKNCKRTLHMLEPDVVIYTNEIAYRPDESLKGKQTFYEYIVA